MSWVTIVWSMIASACLTLAAMHLLVWSRRRAEWANLVFSLSATGVAAYAGCELRMLRAETPAEFGLALRWAHVPVWVTIVALVAFARLYLRTGRSWLAWTVVGVRTLALLLNFGPAPNLNYREVTVLRRVPFLGDTVSVGEGVHNPWMLVGQLSLLLLVIFVVDACLEAWRNGERRQALVVGGSIAFFAGASMIESVLVLGGNAHAPLTASPFYLGLLAAMGYQLSDDVFHSARLLDDLREREQQIALVADAADLGLWIWTTRQDTVWATEKLNPMLGFAPGAPISVVSFLEHVHPDDRETHDGALYDARWTRSRSTRPSIASCCPTAASGGSPRTGGWRVPARDGAVRMLGVCIDITNRKRAEEQFRLAVEATPSAVVLLNGERPGGAGQRGDRAAVRLHTGGTDRAPRRDAGAGTASRRSLRRPGGVPRRSARTHHGLRT